jgi:pimeloyl-ACP methyl ester carboxylesterase
MMAGTSVTIPVLPATALSADVVIPSNASGVVVFAHGSGSSRTSPRNRLVAEHLQRCGLATVLTDLLTDDEEAIDGQTGRFRFNIDLLADRLGSVIEWTSSHDALATLPVGLFGASTGAAAAIVAAVDHADRVGAVVSRGGRPDLAGPSVGSLAAPLLLIVGSADPHVLDLNRATSHLLRCEWRLEIVQGATHLFEEPGALDRVADLAADWLTRHLAAIREGAE